MDEQPITAELSVAEVMRLPGPVQQVFLRRRTACVGCSLARFCTLRDVAATYELELGELIGDVERATHAQTQRT